MCPPQRTLLRGRYNNTRNTFVSEPWGYSVATAGSASATSSFLSRLPVLLARVAVATAGSASATLSILATVSLTGASRGILSQRAASRSCSCTSRQRGVRHQGMLCQERQGCVCRRNPTSPEVCCNLASILSAATSLRRRSLLLAGHRGGHGDDGPRGHEGARALSRQLRREAPRGLGFFTQRRPGISELSLRGQLL